MEITEIQTANLYSSKELICTSVLCDDVSLARKKSVTTQKIKFMSSLKE